MHGETVKYLNSICSCASIFEYSRTYKIFLCQLRSVFLIKSVSPSELVSLSWYIQNVWKMAVKTNKKISLRRFFLLLCLLEFYLHTITCIHKKRVKYVAGFLYLRLSSEEMIRNCQTRLDEFNIFLSKWGWVEADLKFRQWRWRWWWRWWW